MFRLFRQLRQRLLAENRFSRYLLYAVGEIALVVIGILIALQVNNWNEARKERIGERKLITALIEEIASNLDSLAANLNTSRIIADQTGGFLEKSASGELTHVWAARVPSLFGYTSNRTESSVLREILGSDSRALLSDDRYIKQLRKLKRNFDRNDKTLSYVDAYWNVQVLEYLNETGLGAYVAATEAFAQTDREVEITPALISRLGVMHGLQASLIRSREDLQSALTETLNLLQQTK